MGPLALDKVRVESFEPPLPTLLGCSFIDVLRNHFPVSFAVFRHGLNELLIFTLTPISPICAVLLAAGRPLFVNVGVFPLQLPNGLDFLLKVLSWHLAIEVRLAERWKLLFLIVIRAL